MITGGLLPVLPSCLLEPLWNHSQPCCPSTWTPVPWAVTTQVRSGGGIGDCEFRAHVGSLATAGGDALDQQSVGGVSVSGTMFVGKADR